MSDDKATVLIPDHLPDRLDRDTWFDEVLLVGLDQPVMRMITVPRFKTSGLSGDEWRVSYRWERFDSGWHEVDGCNGFDACVAMLYTLVAEPNRNLSGDVSHVQFRRKGREFVTTPAVSNEHRQTMPLLQAAGFVPWWLVMAGDRGMDRDAKWERSLCCQPGCAEQAISTYRKIRGYFPQSYEHRPAERSNFNGESVYPWRRFCGLHLRRGDCGLDDADLNYVVIDGPGPDTPRAKLSAQLAESPSAVVVLASP